MDTEVRADRAGVLDRMREVAQALRAPAALVDTGGEPTNPGYDLVREAGLLGLLVPKAFGGMGLGFRDYTGALAELALADGATALGFNMHNVAIGSLCESAGTELPERADAFRRWVFREVVEGRRMFASATSEAATGARLRGLTTTYRPVDDGFLLDGRKSFVSLAGVADYYVVAAAPHDATDDDDVSHFVVARDDPGVEFGGIWQGSALAGTRTATMTMRQVVVPRERLFLGVEGISLFKLVREPHWMVAGYIGAYLGIAEAIVRFTVEFVRADARRAGSVLAQAEVGRMTAELAAARALVYDAADLVDTARGSLAANTAVHEAKYVLGELGPRLALTAVRVCGSIGLSRTAPLERLLRESSYCAVMPAKPDDCLAYVGRSALGFDMFHAHTVDW